MAGSPNQSPDLPPINCTGKFCISFCETKSYLRLIHSNVADVELTYPSLDVRGCQGLNIAKENMRLGAPYLLLQGDHRRARQGDKSYSQPCHISLNLGLQGNNG